ncbi:hypothetical protein K438DRAFT_1982075 [Mycena galopus ATCC 62051]|nr:hypothetical protein K438DRAFT_1982075 [Mycena galopus ATCC 62051]
MTASWATCGAPMRSRTRFHGQYFVRVPSSPSVSISMSIHVAYLLVLETLNTGFNMQMMYQPLILQYGQVLDYIFFSPRRVLAIVARLAPRPHPRSCIQY